MTPLDQVRKALEPFAHIADRVELDMPRALQRGENVIIHHPAHDPIPPVAFGRFIDAREALATLDAIMAEGEDKELVERLRQSPTFHMPYSPYQDDVKKAAAEVRQMMIDRAVAADRITLLSVQLADARAAGFKRAKEMAVQEAKLAALQIPPKRTSVLGLPREPLAHEYGNYIADRIYSLTDDGA